MKPTIDFRVTNHGSVVLITPLTDQGTSWLNENVQTESWQWFGNSLSCEPRYVEDLLNGAINDGLLAET